jgi:hypothetical protein
VSKLAKSLTESEIEYIITRVLKNATDTLAETERSKDPFDDGKRQAYYEILTARDINVKKYGLDINLEKLL